MTRSAQLPLLPFGHSECGVPVGDECQMQSGFSGAANAPPLFGLLLSLLLLPLLLLPLRGMSVPCWTTGCGILPAPAWYPSVLLAQTASDAVCAAPLETTSPDSPCDGTAIAMPCTGARRRCPDCRPILSTASRAPRACCTASAHGRTARYERRSTMSSPKTFCTSCARPSRPLPVPEACREQDPVNGRVAARPRRRWRLLGRQPPAWRWRQRREDASTGSTPWIPRQARRPRQGQHGDGLHPVYEEQKSGSPGTVTISPEIQQNLGVRLAKVERLPIHQQIETVGYVGNDEDRLEAVNARMAGWIRTLAIKSEGSRSARGSLRFTSSTPRIWSTPSTSTCSPSTPPTRCCCAPPRASSSPCRYRRIR